MVFEEGKSYKHSGGRVIHVCGSAKTHYYGNCLVAEESCGELVPVGTDEAAAQHWHEISFEEFLQGDTMSPRYDTGQHDLDHPGPEV